MKNPVSRFRADRFSLRIHPLFLGCMVAAVSLAFLSAAAAEEAVPQDEPAAVAGDFSPQGRRLLLSVIAVAGGLIAMERGCSWRLGVRQRRASLALENTSPTPRPLVPPAPLMALPPVA